LRYFVVVTAHNRPDSSVIPKKRWPVGADPMCLPKRPFGIVADSGPFRNDER